MKKQQAEAARAAAQTGAPSPEIGQAAPEAPPEAPSEPPSGNGANAEPAAAPARRRRRGRRGSGSGAGQQAAAETGTAPTETGQASPEAPPEATSERAAAPSERAAAPAESAADAEPAAAPSQRRRRGRRGSGSEAAQEAEPPQQQTPAAPARKRARPATPPQASEAPAREGTPARARAAPRAPRAPVREPAVKPAVTADISFMHPSEREFADLLDYYRIPYLYEPRSFPLRWDGNRVVEMHTPDFYLPEYDQYFELTTMKQNLVTQKNRKMRHVQELYPEINIQLLYRRDLMRLMGKYGFGPLADVTDRGTERVLFSAEQIQARVKELGAQLSEEYAGTEPVLIGVLRGVVVFMADLMRHIDLPMQIEFMEISHYGEEREDAIEVIRDVTTDLKGRHVLLVEDIVDTGLTLRYLLSHLDGMGPASVRVCTLLDKSVRRVADVPVDYVGFEVPDSFVIGYGLDYGGRYRNLPYIGVLDLPEPKAVAQR